MGGPWQGCASRTPVPTIRSSNLVLCPSASFGSGAAGFPTSSEEVHAIPPLTQNPWPVESDPELGPVLLSHLHHIDRARHAIEAIARMVGNSASEPDATGGQPLDAWTVAALMGGVEGLCDHLGTLTDAMLAQARFCEMDADLGDVAHDAPSSIQ